MTTRTRLFFSREYTVFSCFARPSWIAYRSLITFSPMRDERSKPASAPNAVPHTLERARSRGRVGHVRAAGHDADRVGDPRRPVRDQDARRTQGRQRPPARKPAIASEANVRGRREARRERLASARARGQGGEGRRARGRGDRPLLPEARHALGGRAGGARLRRPRRVPGAQRGDARGERRALSSRRASAQRRARARGGAARERRRVLEGRSAQRGRDDESHVGGCRGRGASSCVRRRQPPAGDIAGSRARVVPPRAARTQFADPHHAFEPARAAPRRAGRAAHAAVLRPPAAGRRRVRQVPRRGRPRRLCRRQAERGGEAEGVGREARVGRRARQTHDPRTRRVLLEGGPGVRHEVGPAAAAVHRGAQVGVRRLRAGGCARHREDRREGSRRVRGLAVRGVRPRAHGHGDHRAGARRAASGRAAHEGGGEGAGARLGAPDENGHAEHAGGFRIRRRSAARPAAVRPHQHPEGVRDSSASGI